jgi:hypothetical protein
LGVSPSLGPFLALPDAIPSDMTPTKHCKRCNSTLSTDEFNRDKRRTDGLGFYCRTCTRRMAKTSWQRRVEDPLKRAEWVAKERARHLKRKYGISVEDYDQLLASQDGKCAICDATECQSGSALAVDHCHSTGKVRGILCRDCNTTLGKFNDDRSRFFKAIAYLGRAETNRRLLHLPEAAVEVARPTTPDKGTNGDGRVLTVRPET